MRAQAGSHGGRQHWRLLKVMSTALSRHCPTCGIGEPLTGTCMRLCEQAASNANMQRRSRRKLRSCAEQEHRRPGGWLARPARLRRCHHAGPVNQGERSLGHHDPACPCPLARRTPPHDSALSGEEAQLCGSAGSAPAVRGRVEARADGTEGRMGSSGCGPGGCQNCNTASAWGHRPCAWRAQLSGCAPAGEQARRVGYRVVQAGREAEQGKARNPQIAARQDR